MYKASGKVIKKEYPSPDNMNKQITVIVGVLLHKNKVLMALRHEPELPEAHLKWEFPGGKIAFGETPQEALIREFFEETGKIIAVDTLLPFVQTSYWNYPDGVRQTLCFVFLCHLLKNKKPEVKDQRIAKVAWFSLPEAKELDALPGTKEILDLVRM